jgi:hypothetical protein
VCQPVLGTRLGRSAECDVKPHACRRCRVGARIGGRLVYRCRMGLLRLVDAHHANPLIGLSVRSAQWRYYPKDCEAGLALR